MKPGRELDALIAEKVMGGGEQTSTASFSIFGDLQLGFPHYSTDIAAALAVVEKMPDRARMAIYSPGAIVEPGRHNGVEWMVRIFAAPDDNSPWDFENPITVFAETAPLAICLAALKTLEESKK